MITLEQLTERKKTVEDDIKRVEEAIRDLDAQRTQLQANLYALQGAIQQIDFFLEQSQETKEESKRKTK